MMRQYLDFDLEHKETSQAMVRRRGKNGKALRNNGSHKQASFWVLLLHLFKLKCFSQNVGNGV